MEKKTPCGLALVALLGVLDKFWPMVSEGFF
jgi:hypothetical protein